MIKEQIQELLSKAAKSIGTSDLPMVLVEVPGDKSHGDYSSSLALGLSKTLKKAPVEVAKEIVLQMKPAVQKKLGIDKIEVAGPGFINFYLSPAFFVNNIKGINKNVGRNTAHKGEKIIVEYTDPNPFKELHIGHLMSNTIGESLSRIFEFEGAKVRRANYQGDVGLHVAKAIWAKMKDASLEWAKAYAAGSKKYEEDPIAKQEIEALNKKIYERSDVEVNELYDQGKKESLKRFEDMYKVLGTSFDHYFFESKVAGFGKTIVQKNMGNVFEAGAKGAIIFKGEKVGLHTRVFINSEGIPTYEAKELGLAKLKYDTYKYDTSVIVTGNEINEYFKVLLAAMTQVFPDLAKKTVHVGHGMMRLPEGKMSSRTGKVITAEFLLGEIEKMVQEKLQEREWPDKEKAEIAKVVAVGALKCSILKQGIGSDIIYDFEKSISFKGDSGPYLQYAYARAQSVLRKAKKEKVKTSLKKVPEVVGDFEKMMSRFEEVVQKAGQEKEPHYIVLYLTELAAAFNHYYAQNMIVDSANPLSSYRVALVQAFSYIMKNGLWLLGISAPERM